MFDLFRSRDKAVRIVLGALLGLVGLSMVTYLIPTSGMDTTSAPDSTVIATVGKQQITSQEVGKAITSVTQSRQLPPQLLAIYVPQIVQQMISERAMAYEAGRLGMRVSSDETDNAVMDSLPPQLIKDGKVDAATLAQVLAQQGVSMADLKSDTARQLLVSRLRQIVAEGVVVTPAEIEASYHEKNDKTRIEYAVLSPARYDKEAEPTEAEIQAYYNANKASFQTPEKRSLGLIVIDPEKLKPIVPTDAQLRKDYNANLDQFRTPERVNARHILIKSDASNDAAMKVKAEGILKQIQAGGDFAKLAKEYSQDNAPGGSAEKGGELGWLVRGQTVPEFEKAAFSLQPGQTSGLVKTEYGYHIIQVEQHEQAHLESFEEAKPQLMRTFMEREQSDQLQTMADKAAAELRKDPMHPDKAAEAVGLTAIHADNVQAGDPLPEIGNAKEVTDALAPLHKGDVAGPIVLPGNKIVVVSVTDYQPARQATLEEAKADVRNRARQEKLQKILVAKANELLAKAKSLNGDLEKAGKEMGIEVKTSMDVNRQGAIEGVGTAGTLVDAFTKPEGTPFGPLSVGNSQEMVGKVIARIPANPADLPKQMQAIRNELKQQKAADRTTLFEEGLKRRLIEEGKLKINEAALSRLVQNYTSRTS
jgi:peptidyl-prolyl cis-trans isomerase D